MEVSEVRMQEYERARRQTEGHAGDGAWAHRAGDELLAHAAFGLRRLGDVDLREKRLGADARERCDGIRQGVDAERRAYADDVGGGHA